MPSTGSNELSPAPSAEPRERRVIGPARPAQSRLRPPGMPAVMLRGRDEDEHDRDDNDHHENRRQLGHRCTKNPSCPKDDITAPPAGAIIDRRPGNTW